MLLTLDRDLPVPVGTQLRGLIEYGIACGELGPGARLPSVRELAEDAGVAPMTVSQVYRDLKDAGLIETRAGSGTFVASRTTVGIGADARLAHFHRKLDGLIEEGLDLGLRTSDIAGLVGARLSSRQSGGRNRRIVLVGIFAAATAAYAATIATELGAGVGVGVGVGVEPMTIDALRRDAGALRRAGAADLVLTMAHRFKEVAALLPHRRVVAIRFIPSEATRLALAALAPRDKVLCVSRVPEFLAMMKPGVQRFAPHVGHVAAALFDAGDLDGLIGRHDVMVYATGAEAVLGRLPAGARAIEYRHVPDPGDIERLVRPLLDIDDAAAARGREAS